LAGGELVDDGVASAGEANKKLSISFRNEGSTFCVIAGLGGGSFGLGAGTYTTSFMAAHPINGSTDSSIKFLSALRIFDLPFLCSIRSCGFRSLLVGEDLFADRFVIGDQLCLLLLQPLYLLFPYRTITALRASVERTEENDGASGDREHFPMLADEACCRSRL